MHEDVDEMEILQYFDINILSPLLKDEGEKLLSVYIGKQFFFIVPQDSIYNNPDKKDGGVIGIYLSFLCVGFPIDGIVFRHFKSKLLQAELKCLKTKPSIGKLMHKKDK